MDVMREKEWGISDKDCTFGIGLRAGENVERLVAAGRFGHLEAAVTGGRLETSAAALCAAKEVAAARLDASKEIAAARLDASKEVAASRFATAQEIAAARLEASKETAGIRELIQGQRITDLRFELARAQSQVHAHHAPSERSFRQPEIASFVPMGPVGVTNTTAVPIPPGGTAVLPTSGPVTGTELT